MRAINWPAATCWLSVTGTCATSPRDFRREGDRTRGDEGVVGGFEMAGVIPPETAGAERHGHAGHPEKKPRPRRGARRPDAAMHSPASAARLRRLLRRRTYPFPAQAPWLRPHGRIEGSKPVRRPFLPRGKLSKNLAVDLVAGRLGLVFDGLLEAAASPCPSMGTERFKTIDIVLIPLSGKKVNIERYGIVLFYTQT